MSERNVTIEVLFEKNFAAKAWSSCRDPREIEWRRRGDSRAGEGKRARLPEIGLSLFKASAAAWWTTLEPSGPPLYAAALLRSFRVLPLARSEDPREWSWVGRWKRRRRGRRMAKTLLTEPPRRILQIVPLLEIAREKTIISVQCYRKIKFERMFNCVFYICQLISDVSVVMIMTGIFWGEL